MVIGLNCNKYNTFPYLISFSFCRWVTSQWGSCSKSCGVGIQHRKVNCMALTSTGDANVSISECHHIKRPKNHQKCHKKICPPEWEVGSWSKVGYPFNHI